MTQLTKQYPLALFIGRFQPFHKGHLYALEKALEIGDEVMVGVGSSNLHDEKNPWGVEVREKMVRAVVEQMKDERPSQRAGRQEMKVIGIRAIPDVFNDKKWGELILALIKEAGYEPGQVVAVGNNDWTNRIMKAEGIAVTETGLYRRNELEGMKIREMMKGGDEGWKERVPRGVVNCLKVQKIVEWLRGVYGERPAVVAVSGGVDSAVALDLAVRALGKERVTALLLPYGEQEMEMARGWVGKLGVEVVEQNIAGAVVAIEGKLDGVGKERRGNVMARVRMIYLFDLAKEQGALVLGTENKSEHYLGYYTRYGDEASDVEPLLGLYKTQVWELARELGLPEEIIKQAPSAGLWRGQTDEEELGFSYQEADQVLRLLVDGEVRSVRGIAVELAGKVEKQVVEKVVKRVKENEFKHRVPYRWE